MKKLVIFLLALTCMLHVSAQNSKDVIMLKNGTVLRGVILQHQTGEFIKFKAEDGSIQIYPIDAVERFTKEYVTSSAIISQRQTFAEINSNAPWRPRGYRGFAELGTAFAFNYPDVYLHLDTSHGFQATPNFFLGAGFGVHFNTKRSWVFVPIFANLRFPFTRERLSPFIDVKVGYSPFDVKGAYCSVGVGAHYSLSRHLGVNVSLGYDMQKYDAMQAEVEAGKLDKPSDYMHGLNIKLGVEF